MDQNMQFNKIPQVAPVHVIVLEALVMVFSQLLPFQQPLAGDGHSPAEGTGGRSCLHLYPGCLPSRPRLVSPLTSGILSYSLT